MSQRNPDEYPAQYGGKEPIYEMDPNQAPGTPFASPLALRAVSPPCFFRGSVLPPPKIVSHGCDVFGFPSLYGSFFVQAKIQSFLNISKWAPHVAFVRYEDMLASDTAELVSFCLPRQCDFYDHAVCIKLEPRRCVEIHGLFCLLVLQSAVRFSSSSLG